MTVNHGQPTLSPQFNIVLMNRNTLKLRINQHVVAEHLLICLQLGQGNCGDSFMMTDDSSLDMNTSCTRKPVAITDVMRIAHRGTRLLESGRTNEHIRDLKDMMTR